MKFTYHDVATVTGTEPVAIIGLSATDMRHEIGPVAGLRGGLRGHRPTLLLDLCWSHTNICTYIYARIYSVECIYTEILML